MYTCAACQLTFITPEHQRDHYRTDWHRYNLKRKVANLTPVTADVFAQRMLWMQKVEENQRQDTSYIYTCTCCQKTFSNESTYSNHVQSKKHKDKLKLLQQQNVQGEIQERGENQDERKEDKLKQRSHPNFIPSFSSSPLSSLPNQPISSSTIGNKEEKSNLPFTTSTNLLKRKRKLVQRKTTPSFNELTEFPEWDLTQCLFCKEKAASMEDILDHMTSIHSFYIPEVDYLIDLPGLLTYLGQKVSVGHACLWCNTFESTAGLFDTLNDVRRHMLDKSHCQMHFEEDGVEYIDFYDFSLHRNNNKSIGLENVEKGNLEEDEDEDEDEDKLMEGEDGEWEDISDTENGLEVDEAMQLVLPNGKALGHRDLKKYYKQNHLRDETRLITVPPNAKSFATLPAPPSPAILHKFRDEWVRLGIKANKLQKHFRQQVLY